MILYLDTSAWFRLYVDEAGRDAVVRRVEEAELVCTHLVAYAELHAALARAVRIGRVAEGDAVRLIAQVDRDWPAMTVIQVDEPLVVRAARLTGQFGLRGYDSVHLAAVERLASQAGTEAIRFACFDEALCGAAARLGITLMSGLAAPPDP